jgi:uncharacterized protein
VRSDPETTVEAAYAAWRVRDLEALVAYMSDDIILHIHVPDAAGPFAGEVSGKPAVTQRLSLILDDFEFLTFLPKAPIIDGEFVRALVEFHGRHKASGEEIQCTMRHVWRVQNGTVTRVDEYHDGEMVRAFMMLAQARAQTQNAR